MNGAWLGEKISVQYRFVCLLKDKVYRLRYHFYLSVSQPEYRWRCLKYDQTSLIQLYDQKHDKFSGYNILLHTFHKWDFMQPKCASKLFCFI